MNWIPSFITQIRQDAVIDRNALFNSLITKQVIQSINRTWVALDDQLATVNTDADRSRMRAFIFHAGLADAQSFTSARAITLDGDVSDFRQIEWVNLLHRQVVDEHH